MTYTLTSGTVVIRDVDGVSIPDDPNNVDWQGYQAWLASGNTASPMPTAAVIIPETIEDWQFFMQLAIQGVLGITMADAKAYVGPGTLPAVLVNAIAQMPAQAPYTQEQTQDIATVLITGAHTFQRHNATTVLLGQLLGQTSAELDAIWIAAAALFPGSGT